MSFSCPTAFSDGPCFTLAKNWTEAQRICESHGSNLATITGAMANHGLQRAARLEPPSQTYTLDPDYGLNFICSEASRLAAPCGLCGPNWGDLAACQAECDDTVGCTAITWFTDNGCRLYSACSAADPNPFGVLTSIYIRDV